ncbi:putative membrane protein [Saccharothrix tamanrassetensis]|uniref:Putative membrane protein n=1 Tax=Saccharothrix tamanrassetensis TaxID=1051531 RepID=A0A841CX95_9PSEU|nr:glycosyltransferase 87 family protein [Saccharothrix tamanrassetensis]MBB5960555.1 putative membrane protein [Saccharothrix tamanrassetensis]
MSVTREVAAVPERVSGRRSQRFGRSALAALVLLCGLTLLLGFANKDRCTGPSFDQWGRSAPDYEERNKAEVCYSDIQHLWIGRDVDRHVFPYVNGGISSKGVLVGGTVEYPVLTGLLIWAGAVFAHNDASFLLFSALLMAPFGLATAWLLGKLSGRRALLWAIGPPMVLYAFHNWDLPVAFCAVAAVYVVHRGWGRTPRPLIDRAVVAAVLLGLGFAFKIYPAAFVLPLCLYVLTGGRDGLEGRKYDWQGAVKVALASVVTVVLVNLPFAVVGFAGWQASFTFQQLRRVDITTNSIWFWSMRPFMPDETMQALAGVLSPLGILASFALACWIGWRRFRREGVYPWVPVSAAMLCGFLLLHKVHSPQYTLWLVPMFVLLRIPLGWVYAYFVVDIAMGIGIFRWYYAIEFGQPSGIYDGFSAQAVVIGVWGRAALLAALFFVFLRSQVTFRDRPLDRLPATAEAKA